MDTKKRLNFSNNPSICIVGLGYVGLPLAVHLSSIYNVIGFDINTSRIEKLNQGIDETGEVSKKELSKCLNKNLQLISEESSITNLFDLIIVTVPTPVDKNNIPNLRALVSASKFSGRNIKKNSIIVFESTVFPGCTEDICVPEIEKESGLVYQKDFFCGYSPERINPGDKEHTFDRIPKVVSGSNEQVSKYLSKIYGSVIKANIHVASTIKIAEASKVIENTQRDINIAFINELSIIFNKLDINTNEVLKAASTKWNFLNFKPGLVGGHCIGVDPYYLAHKASEVGIDPQMILAGRKINNSMPSFVAAQVVKKVIKKKLSLKKSKILLLGLTFKENCPDTRNSKSIDLIHELNDYGLNIYAHDPYVNEKTISSITLAKPVKKIDIKNFDMVILSVEHKEYKNLLKTNKDLPPIFSVSMMGFIDND